MALRTNYYTKWPKAMALGANTVKDVAKFIYQNIMNRSECPLELVRDQGKYFMDEVM